MSFKNEDKIKIFSDKGKLREYVTSRIALQDMLTEVLQAKGRNWKKTHIFRNDWRAMEVVNMGVNIKVYLSS